MKIIFKNQFVEYAIDAERATSRITYFAATIEMEEEEFKESVIKIFKYGTDYQIDKSLLDFRELRFTISPSLQEWMIEALKDYRRLKKSATIVPSDFIPNLAIEQTMEEIDDTFQQKDNSENRYFDNEEDALKWLLED